MEQIHTYIYIYTHRYRDVAPNLAARPKIGFRRVPRIKKAFSLKVYH